MSESANESANEDVSQQQESWFRIATRCAAGIRKQSGTDRLTEGRMVRVFRAEAPIEVPVVDHADKSPPEN